MVTQIANAVSAQDVSKFLALIDPPERSSLGALIAGVRSQASQDDLVAATGVPLPWASVRVDELSVAPGASDRSVAFVTVSANVNATVEHDKLPSQLRVSSGHDLRGSASTDEIGRRLPEESPPVVGVVRLGGRWYLSPTTTVLEGLRRHLDLPAPDFSVTSSSRGGASDPGAVLTGLAEATRDGNPQEAVDLVSRSEFPALSAYYPVFAEQLRQATGSDQHVDTDFQTVEQPMSDGLVKVAVSQASGDQRSDDLCLRNRVCAENTLATLTRGQQAPFVVVGKESGAWRIDPIATVVEYLRVVVADGSRNLLYRLFEVPEAAPVSATLQVGADQRVKLNDAAFAHVVIQGRAGSCFTQSGDPKVQTGSADDIYVAWRAYDDYDETTNTDCYRFPADGKIEGIVIGDTLRQRSTVVTLNLRN